MFSGGLPGREATFFWGSQGTRLKTTFMLGIVVHICNSSYSGG